MDWELMRYADRLTVDPLVDALFGVLLATPELPISLAQREALEGADEPAYEAALDELEPHKVFPLLDHQLEALGLADAVPARVRQRLSTVRRQVRALNTLHFLSAAAALKGATLASEPVLVLKGLLFADSYYPEFSTRPMGDVDLVSWPGRGQALFDIMEKAGFHKVETQEDAVLYEAAQGVHCDVHDKMRMFEGYKFDDITVPVELSMVRGVRVRAFEPHALLAHLVTHCWGHGSEIGLVLLWMIDFAFALRHGARDVDPERVRAMVGDPQIYGLFLRILGFLLASGEVLGPVLTERARSVPPLTLGEVLRQRRIVPWRLPSPRGWLRLAVHVLHLRKNEHRPEVAPLDLVVWPLDELNTRLARKFAR